VEQAVQSLNMNPNLNFDGFGTILTADMKVVTPNYLNKYAIK
jgi:hypothetical protein